MKRTTKGKVPQIPNDSQKELEEHAKKWSNEEENIRGCDYIGAAVSEKAFVAGAQWQKQQMMKEAVVTDVLGHCSGWLHFGYVPECDYDFKQGDKVKLIIVKEG